MDISVVIPFRDAQRHIDECIGALLAQTYPRERFEVVMVDNNSVDRSAEIVRRYPHLRLLRESSPGPYAARNRGVAEASGRVIAFTDADCAPDSDWLERIDEAMADPALLVIQGRARFATESAALSALSDYEEAKSAYTFASRISAIYYARANNMAVRRSVFDRIGPFGEVQRGGDVVFVHRVIQECSCDVVQYRPEVCVRHLEVSSCWKWFQKMNVYGRSLRRYRTLVPARPLNGLERLDVFKATIRHGRYSVARSIFLLGVLSVGALYYELGRWSPGRVR